MVLTSRGCSKIAKYVFDNLMVTSRCKIEKFSVASSEQMGSLEERERRLLDSGSPLIFPWSAFASAHTSSTARVFSTRAVTGAQGNRLMCLLGTFKEEKVEVAGLTLRNTV